MDQVELYVGLKIPDTTAITTFHVLERMGYKVKQIKREVYYNFQVEGDIREFSKKIGKTDILVNANKNTSSFELKKEEGAVYVQVKDIGDGCTELLSALRDRLGLKEIKSMQRGILWSLQVDSEKTAKEIAKKLLYNENYQEMKILN